MDALIYSLNTTLPVFFTMMLGFAFRRAGIINESFALGMNRFVFRIALPVSLFSQLCAVDFLAVWDTSFVVFCFAATLLSVVIAAVLSRFLRDRSLRGEFIQGAYRSSASLLGSVYMYSMYGSMTFGSLMMIGSVPLYNVIAVIVLSPAGQADGKPDRKRVLAAAKDMVTNPIILGILTGFVWGMLKIPVVPVMDRTLNYLGSLASPMGLLAMGALLEPDRIGKNLRPALLASFLKLIGFAAIFIPAAVYLGFTGEKLAAILIMLGSASTVAGYIMAKNMGHEGSLSAASVMITTVLTSFTLTFWIWLLRSLGLL